MFFFLHEITQKNRSRLRDNFFQFGFMFLGVFLKVVNWFIFIIGIFLGVLMRNLVENCIFRSKNTLPHFLATPSMVGNKKGI